MQMGGNECRELFTAISATLKKEPALYLQQKPTFFYSNGAGACTDPEAGADREEQKRCLLYA